MKLAILSALVGAAAAFAPSQKAATTTSLGMADYSNELGAIPPVGFFDPFGLSTNISPELFEWYRAAELKHGRVAMLCVLGYIAPETYHFPGCEDIPSGLAAIESPAFITFVVSAGLVEYDPSYLGDFEIGKPDLSPETFASRRTQELQHGRLAMLATLELFRHDVYDNSEQLIQGFPWLYQ